MSSHFSNNFVEMFLGWPSIRFLQAMLIGRKLCPPRGGAYMAKGERSISVLSLNSNTGAWWANDIRIYHNTPALNILTVSNFFLKMCCIKNVKESLFCFNYQRVLIVNVICIRWKVSSYIDKYLEYQYKKVIWLVVWLKHIS